MPLASSVKELGAILQKLIKNVNLDKIQHKNFDDGASIGDADRLLQLLQAVGDVRLGANESAKRKQFCSLKNCKMSKRSRFKLCWLTKGY